MWTVIHMLEHLPRCCCDVLNQRASIRCLSGVIRTRKQLLQQMIEQIPLLELHLQVLRLVLQFFLIVLDIVVARFYLLVDDCQLFQGLVCVALHECLHVLVQKLSEELEEDLLSHSAVGWIPLQDSSLHHLADGQCALFSQAC